MYPGQGNYSYGDQPPNYNHNRPNGPPPQGLSFGAPSAPFSTYNNQGAPSPYGRPPGPPPGPPSMSHNRPPVPPPSVNSYNSLASYQQHNQPYQQHQYQPQQIYQHHSQPLYSRPPGPPPGVAAQQSMQNHDYQYTNPNTGQTIKFQRPKDLPSNNQSFGQGTNLTFKYSNCSGRKKALLMGCNYAGQGGRIELKGCINDVYNIKNFIVTNYGYKEENIVVLADDQTQLARVPTRDNMIRAMRWLVKDAQPNDSLFFHWSGHGGVVEDEDGDEDDGFDNTIYPTDFKRAGVIVDDLMHNIMIKPLPPGCRLTSLFDSCHSGTALDLPYIYSTKGVIKEPNLLKTLGTDGLSMLTSYAQGNIQGTIQSVTSLFDKVSHSKSKDQRDKIIRMKASAADVISISGCKDDQTSADARIGGQSTGAMSYAFVTVLSRQPVQSYISLLNNMRAQLSGKYSQKPQLSSSHPIDTNIQFII